MKKTKNSQNKKRLPSGLSEFLAALGIVFFVLLLVSVLRSCGASDEDENEDEADGATTEDTAAETEELPTATVLDPLILDGIELPLSLTAGITVDQLYTATGRFPEDGSDEAVENVLAVKLSNTTDKTLEYLTFTLTVNGEEYPFAVTTLPGGESIHVFNSERKTAPETVTSAAGETEYEIYFAEEPSVHSESLAFEVQNGTIVVTNISETDITSDIMVYYKTKSDSGYLGGITYRFRISGGLPAGKSHNAYAPHAYVDMTEVMFVQYEE